MNSEHSVNLFVSIELFSVEFRILGGRLQTSDLKQTSRIMNPE